MKFFKIILDVLLCFTILNNIEIQARNLNANSDEDFKHQVSFKTRDKRFVNGFLDALIDYIYDDSSSSEEYNNIEEYILKNCTYLMKANSTTSSHESISQQPSTISKQSGNNATVPPTVEVTQSLKSNALQPSWYATTEEDVASTTAETAIEITKAAITPAKTETVKETTGTVNLSKAAKGDKVKMDTTDAIAKASDVAEEESTEPLTTAIPA